MPFTVNGIGTQYYGRKNPRLYSGQCSACRNLTTLSDYETGHYVVVFYIPVIPLGRKQIVAECGSCSNHRALPVDAWEKMREQSLNEGFDRLANEVGDPAAALDLLERLTIFNQMDEAKDLAAATCRQHSDSFDTQIDVGNWYAQQGLSSEAEARFDRAIQIAPKHPTSLRIQGLNALEDGNPKAAAQHFEPLREMPEHDDDALFFQLALGYQKLEMHAEALAEFAKMLEKHPDHANQKLFRKAVRLSEKAVDHPESILSKRGIFG